MSGATRATCAGYICTPRRNIATIILAAAALLPGAAVAVSGELEMQPIPSARYEFGGVLGERLKANIDQWLLPCPHANPGMLEMFRMRDRKPVPQLVPWAGEFAGKYLISLVHALRATTDERLHEHTKKFVAELIATQSPEGYVGPFPMERRLLGEWDLWGHYHVILGLLNWHEFSGEEAAMASARKAADFICSVYLETGKRPIEAGSDEMNLAIIHAMARLHRLTGEPRYLAMARVVEEDWEKAGDYLRQGLANVPFYKTPRPRWESLHDIQGMVEMYRITGEEKYKTAFKNLWTSIRDFDRHNTGGFTTGEQAIGDPYTPGAIETCCTVAWSCLGIDMLQLTGDSTVADELELSLFNGIMGAQHPSGRWFTYNTPMDGKKEASAHSIVFQARAGTPELNCCSVNGPRGLAMVTDWALMQGKNGELIINWLGPMKATAKIGDVEWEVEVGAGKHAGDWVYPRPANVSVQVRANKKDVPAPELRVPKWGSANKYVTGCNDSLLENIYDGGGFDYDGETITTGYNPVPMHNGCGHSILQLQTFPRVWKGEGAQESSVSLYAGPLLLAFDQRDNDLDCADVKQLRTGDMPAAPWDTGDDLAVIRDMDHNRGAHGEIYLDIANRMVEEDPFPRDMILSYKYATVDGREIELRDFATAGSTGTEYRTWVPMPPSPPPAVELDSPAQDETVSSDGVLFRWKGGGTSNETTHVVQLFTEGTGEQTTVDESEATTRNVVYWKPKAEAGRGYSWRVVSRNAVGETVSRTTRGITFDDAIPGIEGGDLALYLPRQDDGALVFDILDAEKKPDYGVTDEFRGTSITIDRHGDSVGALQTSLGGMTRYKHAGFPRDAYSVALWVKVDSAPDRMAQIFSAWAKGGDDPLRVVLEGGKIAARIEGMGGANTPLVPIELGQWHHIAAVKDGANLVLYVDGAEVAKTGAPAIIVSSSTEVALGANPRNTGDESLAAAFDNFSLWARALSAEEVKAMAGK